MDIIGENDIWFNKAEKKLAKPLAALPHDNICLWSDLLGFGKIFFDNNWELSLSNWEAIRYRLFNAHSTAVRYFPINGNILILNDGIAVTSIIVNKRQSEEKEIVKVYGNDGNQIDEFESANALLQMSMFIRNAVFVHHDIIKEEKKNGYPGTRSAIAFGHCFPYITQEITENDFKYTYTINQNQGKKSRSSETDRTVIFNPYAMQMNTAFSKAYIIESAGSKQGITGANLYIDESVLSIIREYAGQLGVEIMEHEEADFTEFMVQRNPDNPTDVVMGFRLSKPVAPGESRFKTKVYRLLRFYPDDELANEFWFDFENPLGYGPTDK